MDRFGSLTAMLVERSGSQPHSDHADDEPEYIAPPPPPQSFGVPLSYIQLSGPFGQKADQMLQALPVSQASTLPPAMRVKPPAVSSSMTIMGSYGSQGIPSSQGSVAESPISSPSMSMEEITARISKRSSSMKIIQDSLASNRNWSLEFHNILKDYFRLRGTIPKLFKEFEETATRIGRTIISERNVPAEKKTIAPLASEGELGVAGGEKYLVGTVFFKYAVDSHGLYAGDHFAMKAAGLELAHLNALFGLQKSDAQKRIFSYPLMCLIDFRGYRLIACSVLPIDETTIVYGSNDQAYSMSTVLLYLTGISFVASVHADSPEVNQMMLETAKQLNLKEHLVTGIDGVARLICGPVDIEAHIGRDGDGGVYLIDYQRLMPPETPTSRRGVHLYRLLRPEFVASFSKPLSSDAFSIWGSHLSAVHNQEVVEATDFLREKVVPQFASYLDSCDPSALESSQVVTEMHSRGINVRYLGLMSELVKSPAARSLLLLELAARIIKGEVRARMREVKSAQSEAFSAAVMNYFNLVFGNTPASSHYWNSTLVDLLNYHFIFRNPLPHNRPIKSHIKLWRLLTRIQELTAITLSIERNPQDHSYAHVFNRDVPFTETSVLSISVRTKRMRSWLDPRLYQQQQPTQSSKSFRSQLLESTSSLPQSALECRIPLSSLKNLKLLLEGVTGNIYRGEWEGQQVALTQFHNVSEFRQFASVVHELRMLNHENLVRIYGIVRESLPMTVDLASSTEGMSRQKEIDSGGCVAEFVSGGTLAAYLEDEDNPMDRDLQLKLMFQIAAGVRYLHGQTPPFMHRNLTCANVLLTPKRDVKINTVRLTRHVGFSCDTSVHGIIPPEIANDREWSEKSDVYCFGIVMWEILTREFPDLSEEFVPELPDHVHAMPEIANLLHMCLHRDPKGRPTFDEIYELVARMRTNSSGAMITV